MTRSTTTIARIEISPYNVRTNEEDVNDRAGLEASILENGLIEPIIVHTMADGIFGAIAGGRRTRSIRSLVERGALPADFPVAIDIRDDLSDAQLFELSLSENMMRRDLRDYEVFAAVAAMAQLGEPLDQIARALGQRRRWVDEALRLGTLAGPIFLAFEQGRINIEQARAFGAVADVGLQASAWEALGFGPAMDRTPAAIRAWYRIEDREAEKLLRFVGRDVYVHAGGWYESDLFDEGADARGRVSDDALLRRLADAKVAALKAGVRERTGRADLRFIPQPPQSGTYGGTDWILHVPVEEDEDGRVSLPAGDVVAAISIDDEGEAEVSYWWASRRAMEGDKPKPAAPVRRERFSAGSAIGRQYDDTRQKADAAIKEEAGLTQEGTQILRSIRRVILRAAIVQDAAEGRTLGRDLLVWSQLRMLLSTAGKYDQPEGSAEVGVRALATPDPDPGAALPLLREIEAGRAWAKAVDAMRTQGFLTDPDLGRAFLAFRAAPAATKDRAAAIVAGLALERSLDADAYRVPVHDVVAAQAGTAHPQGIRHWWQPSAGFLALLPTAERAAIAEPFVEKATFASWGRLKSDELTPLVLKVVTGGANSTRKTQQIAASQWVQPIAQASAYLLTDAIADYRLEWGDDRASGDTIVSRLKHVQDFLDAEEASSGRFGIQTSCAAACTSAFAAAFRAWSRRQPVVWRNGQGKVTVTKPRSPASTEAAIAQVIAALNHAANADPARSDKRPTYRPLPPKQVQRTRRTRIDVKELARIVAYAAEPGKQRGALHAFVVASICTIARPGAVVDICVAPERGQWAPGSPTIDLNPAGRVQNKKARPVLPVLPLLDQWLSAELLAYQALEPEERVGAGYLVNYYGRRVKSVDRAWGAMLEALGLPTGREWRPYVLRHSLATLVRNRGAEAWDLEGFMGHRQPSQTEVYARGEFLSVQRALQTIIEEIERLQPGTLHRTGTGAALAPTTRKGVKMSG